MIFRNRASLIMFLGALLSLADPCRAQMIYNISVYNDVTTDGDMLYAVTTTVDNSTGCQAHGAYSTTARLISPGGTEAVNTSSGMVASTSMAIAGQTGDFTALGSVQLYCGCFMRWVGGGGPSLTITVALAQTGFKWPTLLQDERGWYCHYSSLSCDPATTPTCTSGNWTSSRPIPPCPEMILVEWLRVKIGGLQKCFVVDWDEVEVPPDCQ